MKILGRLLLALLFVIAVGFASHYVLYRSAGLFVWHVESGDSDAGELLVLKRSQRNGSENQQAGVSGDLATADMLSVASAADSKADPEKKKATQTVKTKLPVPTYPVGEAKPLLNGKDLKGWKSIEFGGEGDVFINEDGHLELGFGAIMTGAKWSDEKTPAVSNYEIELDAMRLDGNDFFCGLTFPVKDSHATFIIGGWGGGLVGISSIDDLDASENETMNIEGFEDNKWYHIKLRVTDNRLEAWIDERQMVDVDITDSKISLRPGDIELCKPLGLACFSGVRAQYRNITWKNIDPDAPAAAAEPAAQ
jgi:hypothetical protein